VIPLIGDDGLRPGLVRVVQVRERLSDQVQHDVPVLAGAGQQRDPVGEGRVGDVSVGFVENEPLLDGPQALVGNIRQMLEKIT